MDIRITIEQVLKDSLAKMSIAVDDVKIAVSISNDASHGEYTTNIAMILAKQLGKSPIEVAEEIKAQLVKANMSEIETIEIVKPGFINFFLKKQALGDAIKELLKEKKAIEGKENKKIMVEFAHPNTHKAFHIGHLRNITTGESVVRMLESTGVEVIRVNYQGDVGMHIAKCLYGIQNADVLQQSATLTIREKIDLLGKAYAAGSKAYEEDEAAKKEIGEINKKIYIKDPSIWELYETTRSWSIAYFEEIYKRVYTHFDRFYFESQVYQSGKDIVMEGLNKGIFEKSDGAIIFPGSKYNLHDRVFISGEGNPTYEGKEMGLGPLQFSEYNPDLIVHVVGPEQAGYFQVVFEALAQLFPDTRGKEKHLAYGWVKLKHGKMSSRTGNVILGEWLLDEAKQKIAQAYSMTEEVAEQVAIAAVKYSFLKVGLNQEIAFDINESISLEGNSGPYLQYTYVRCQSIFAKWENQSEQRSTENIGQDINFQTYTFSQEESELLRTLSYCNEIVEQAANDFSPHVLCTYLFTLAQQFNLFYQKQPILKAEKTEQEMRLFLVLATAKAIKDGLALLGIETPEKM